MPGYFGVMGIPLRAGRDISDDDIRHRRRVAVVDERLARQLWQGDAVGRQPLAGRIEAAARGDWRGRGDPCARHPRCRDADPLPSVSRLRDRADHRGQDAGADGGGGACDQASGRGARAGPAGVPHPLDGPGRRSVNRRRAIPDAGAHRVRSGVAGAGRRRTLRHAGLPDVAANARVRRPAGVGRVARRHPGMVVREGGLLAAAGAALGWPVPPPLAQALRGLLYGVTPLDGPTVVGVAALVVAVAVVAVGGPAWRAARSTRRRRCGPNRPRPSDAPPVPAGSAGARRVRAVLPSPRRRHPTPRRSPMPPDPTAGTRSHRRPRPAARSDRSGGTRRSRPEPPGSAPWE